jgi:hypothetical protein
MFSAANSGLAITMWALLQNMALLQNIDMQTSTHIYSC